MESRASPDENTSNPNYALLLVNLTAALITSVILGSGFQLLAFGGAEGSWIVGVLAFIIIVQLTAAMVCAWHCQIPAHNVGMRKALGLTGWIVTGVSLFFLVIVLLAMVIAFFS